MEHTDYSVPKNDARYVRISPSLHTITNSEMPIPFVMNLIDRKTNFSIGQYVFMKPEINNNSVSYSSLLKSFKSNAKVPSDLIKVASSVLEKIAKTNNYEGEGLDLQHEVDFNVMDIFHNKKIKKILDHYKKLGYQQAEDIRCHKIYEN